jgi:hypothetical protein
MRFGTEHTTPQPEAARAAFDYYNKLLPWMNLSEGVREAMAGMGRADGTGTAGMEKAE